MIQAQKSLLTPVSDYNIIFVFFQFIYILPGLIPVFQATYKFFHACVMKKRILPQNGEGM